VRSLPTTPQGRPCGRPPAAAVLGRKQPITTRTIVEAGDPTARAVRRADMAGLEQAGVVHLPYGKRERSR
jgi:hypothetical protein